MMPRVLEPELMNDPEQALAYAKADFEEENQGFVNRLRTYYPDLTEGHVLDLGCGPAGIPIRFVRALPGCRRSGGRRSPAMLRPRDEAVRADRLGAPERQRVHRDQ